MGALEAIGTRVLRSMGFAPASEVKQLVAEVNLLLREKAAAGGNRSPSGVPFSYGQFEYEQNKELRGPNRWKQFELMANDPHVAGGLRANILPLLNGKAVFTAAGDKPKQKDAAEFCNANLLRIPSDKYGSQFWVQTSWRQRLSEIGTCLQYGFAMFGLSTKRVDRFLVFDRIHWLEPSSVDPRGWEIDDQDRLVAVNRTYQTPGGVFKLLEPVLAADIMLYPWDPKGMRLEGRPMTRAQYGAWLRKEFVQRSGAIWAQKAGAPAPIAHCPPNTPPAIRQQFIEFIQSIRGEALAESFWVGEESADGKKFSVEFAGSENNLDRGMTLLVNSENAEIAHGSGTKSDLLGETASGSRALGESQGQRDMMMVSAVAAVISDYETHGVANIPGLVQRLVDANFGPEAGYPMLTFSGLDPTEGERSISFIAQAAASGLLPMHVALMKQVAARLRLVFPDEAFVIPEVAAPGDDPGDENPDGEDGQPERPEEPMGGPPRAGEEKGAARPDGPRPVAARGMGPADVRVKIDGLLQPDQAGKPAVGARRRPNKLESQYVKLAAVEDALDTGERRALQELRRARSSMIADIARRVSDGKITPRNLESQSRSRARGQATLTERLRVALELVAEEGRGHVKEEIGRMHQAGS